MAKFVSKDTPTDGEFEAHDDENNTNFPTANYWKNTSLPSAPTKYWRNNSGTLDEMTQTQKDVVDAAEAESAQKSQVLSDIVNGNNAIASWVANNNLDEATTADKKFINKKLDEVYNSIKVGALPAASDLLANDVPTSGALTQVLIDDLKAEIDVFLPSGGGE